MLARREYSRLELHNKLSSIGAEQTDVRHILDEFEEKGWISEQRFVDAVVRTRRSRFGASRVLRELRDKGVSEDGVARARGVLAEHELDAAREVWRKKFLEKPLSLADRAKQARFLSGRGFSQDVVRKVLDWSDD